jgi:SAM-dependent methyltransferase
MEVFYRVTDVPVHSVLLMPDRDTALNYPKGDIALAFCRACGFISNAAFNSRVHEYSSRYEETQGFSPTFNAFANRLATGLIDRYDLHKKKIIEIGCGKGEFLTLLCELGGNFGVGFDPAYVSERDHSAVKDRVTFIQDFYSEKYSGYKGDFVCCKMTLEHIQNTAEFVSMVRRSIGERTETVVFFQVPDALRILREFAFWDIYYEHCSYFSIGTLGRLFRHCGFSVTDIWRDYDDQYLMIEARPDDGLNGGPFPEEERPEDLSRDIEYFTENCQNELLKWHLKLKDFSQRGRRVVLWGGGSKGVAFFTTLKVRDEIDYVVDINPFKNGTYMAGTGQMIVEPSFLRSYEPDVVIVMNPVYRNEIRQQCENMGLAPEILTV